MYFWMWNSTSTSLLVSIVLLFSLFHNARLLMAPTHVKCSLLSWVWNTLCLHSCIIKRAWLMAEWWSMHVLLKPDQSVCRFKSWRGCVIMFISYCLSFSKVNNFPVHYRDVFNKILCAIVSLKRVRCSAVFLRSTRRRERASPADWVSRESQHDAWWQS